MTATQPDLFGGNGPEPHPQSRPLAPELPVPFQAHSDTSREAAEAITPRLGPLQAAVLEYIRTHPRCSDEEIAKGLEMNPSTARPRRIELMDAGKVYQDGRVENTSGRGAAAWVCDDRPSQGSCQHCGGDLVWETDPRKPPVKHRVVNPECPVEED